MLSKLPDRVASNMTEKKLDTLAASPVQGRRQFGSRAALFAGFGTLLIPMAIASAELTVNNIRNLFLASGRWHST
jgi:hypothetical protein